MLKTLEKPHRQNLPYQNFRPDFSYGDLLPETKTSGLRKRFGSWLRAVLTIAVLQEH